MGTRKHPKPDAEVDAEGSRFAVVSFRLNGYELHRLRLRCVRGQDSVHQAARQVVLQRIGLAKVANYTHHVNI